MLERYLLPREARALGWPSRQVVEYRGHLDEDVLARAFEVLAVRHPLCRARIRRDHEGYLLLYAPADHGAELTLIDGVESGLEREGEMDWDPTSGVCRLSVVRGDKQGFVVFRTDHAMVQGPSFLSLFRELWTLYADIIKGREIRLTSGTLPDVPLIDQDLVDSQSSVQRKGHEREERLATMSAHKVIWHRIRLDMEQTSDVIAAARAAGTTVYAILSGAILVAQRDHAPSLTGAEPMRLLTAIDLSKRRHFDPTEVTMAGGSYAARVYVPLNGDPVQIGRDVKHQIDDAIARYSVPSTSISEIVSESADVHLESRLASASLSSMGVIARFPQPEDISIIDWFVGSGGNEMFMTYPAYASWTYENRLSVFGAFRSPDRFSDSEIDDILGRISSRLIQLGTAGKP